MEAGRGTTVQPPFGGIDPGECTGEFMTLVRRIARTMKRRLPGAVGRDDLLRLGLLGLLQAAQHSTVHVSDSGISLGCEFVAQ